MCREGSFGGDFGLGVVNRSPTNEMRPSEGPLASQGPVRSAFAPRASYGLNLGRAALELLGAAVNRVLTLCVKWREVKIARGATRRHSLRTLRSTADAAVTPRAASV